MLKQISKKKQKRKLIVLQLQRQIQIQKQKELFLISSLILAGALGRAALQYLPSVEPITMISILAGILFGKRKGAFVGASSFYLSNFLVFGGQGPWTMFQMIGAGIAGYLGGFAKKNNLILILLVTFIATILYELIVNLTGIFFVGIYLLPIYYLTSLPFSFIHLISNLFFVLGVPKFANWIENKAKFKEIEERISTLFIDYNRDNSAVFNFWKRIYRNSNSTNRK
jgi:energy-coupling factor transport system substrate-specific component